MSGIYSASFEMPDRCFSCPMCYVDCCGISQGPYIEYREVDVDVAMNGRPEWCPLVPAPDHGLIDREKMLDAIRLELDMANAMNDMEDYVAWMRVFDFVRKFPTFSAKEDTP